MNVYTVNAFNRLLKMCVIREGRHTHYKRRREGEISVQENQAVGFNTTTSSEQKMNENIDN